jgi:hypothetical protein
MLVFISETYPRVQVYIRNSNRNLYFYFQKIFWHVITQMRQTLPHVLPISWRSSHNIQLVLNSLRCMPTKLKWLGTQDCCYCSYMYLKLYIVYLDFFACIFAVYFLGENKAPCKFHCYCLKFTTNTSSPPKKFINNCNIKG